MAFWLPVLKRVMVGNTETKNLGIICSLCNMFNAKNKAGLAAHMKLCRLTTVENKEPIFVKTK
jgi:hypothetical protein